MFLLFFKILIQEADEVVVADSAVVQAVADSEEDAVELVVAVVFAVVEEPHAVEVLHAAEAVALAAQADEVHLLKKSL